MKYRAEIDGLRALAVVPVIFFHAGFELFSGGFVGVDVFFVISGYLITTILIEDIENNRFSIANFYERRARRILPALFFVMLVCIPFAWMWMLPSQMKDFSQSLVAVSFFASNIFFWRESGYFDAAAEEKPLLHTWSLAVEEQYYVLFPIFLILAWRFGKSRVLWMIVVMAAISLMLSEWGWRNKATANFYLAPTRAWELFAGSIAAFIVQKQGVQKNNLLATLGLAAIIFSIFFYDETTPFPSVYALVPVLGVVLLVLYADKETFAAKLLSTKGFVGIGLISYSAYLWHQPLFAFARIKSFEDPKLAIMVVFCVASIALAFFSWRYVEKPFRKREKFSPRQIYAISIIGISTFSLLGLAILKFDGLPNRFPFSSPVSPISKLPCIQKDANLDRCLVPLSGKSTTIYVLGDSHAAQTFLSLDRLSSRNNKKSQEVKYFNNGKNNFFPYSALSQQQYLPSNDPVINLLEKYLRPNDYVVITFHSGRLNGDTYDLRQQNLFEADNGRTSISNIFEENLASVLQIAHEREAYIILQLDNPILPSANWRYCYEESKVDSLPSSCAVNEVQHQLNLKRQKGVFERVCADITRCLVVDINEIFFSESKYYDPVGDFGYVDRNHISDQLIDKLSNFYSKLLNNEN